MSISNPIVAQLYVLPIDGTAAAPSLSFGGSYYQNSGTGMYGTYGQIAHSINGAVALTLTATALTLGSGVSLVAPDASISGALLTGFVSGAGTVSAADTILTAFNKLVGNTQNLTVLANVLTGFSAAAGSVSSADTVLGALQKIVGNTTALQTAAETLSAAGAISVTNPETIVNNATGGSFAMTLAAPSSQDGQLKIIKLGTATSGATLAMTNIATSGAYTPTGTTTLTFTTTGQCAVLMAVGAKWQYVGGSAVAS